MLSIGRAITIKFTLFRYLVNRVVLPKSFRYLRFISYFNPMSYGFHHTRGRSLRLCLETLGPIFVKFGQVLSTRRDLLPEDLADELSKLQDEVAPFSDAVAHGMIAKALHHSVDAVFEELEEEPLASASVAQVYAATLHNGDKVIVKLIRPGIRKTIRRDIQVLSSLIGAVNVFIRRAKQFRLRDVLEEFEHTIYEELDLMKEAANASYLRNKFDGSDLIYVPKVYWQYTTASMMVMERVYGVPISDLRTLKEFEVDQKVLAEKGVEIFFTQVFRDGFFHADMHPGNIFVDIRDPKKPIYCGVDFGIMGTLNREDKQYLAENFLAFFNRDYHRMALLHVESGWVPKHIRVDRLEAAFRCMCEPFFERPLSEISYGHFLLRLLSVAREFEMRVQPQLFLLQKTLLNVEGLGRQLYPDLDLWGTAKPYLEQWMKSQYGFKTLARKFFHHFPGFSEKMLELPDLLHRVLQERTTS